MELLKPRKAVWLIAGLAMMASASFSAALEMIGKMSLAYHRSTKAVGKTPNQEAANVRHPTRNGSHDRVPLLGLLRLAEIPTLGLTIQRAVC